MLTFLGPSQIRNRQEMATIYGPLGSAGTSYVGHSNAQENQVSHFTPVGVLVSYLSQKLAWEDPEHRSFADYYRMTNMSGSGQGSLRIWPSSIYSETIRARVESGALNNGVSWDEWSIAFA